MNPIDDALSKANLRAEDIDLVILAGGSSQLPGVAEKIKEKIGLAPRSIPQNPMLAISYGAALYQRRMFTLPKINKDVRTLGMSLGILVTDGTRTMPELLVDYNEPLPVTKEHTFHVQDGQDVVTIDFVTMHYTSDRVLQHLKKRTLKLSRGAEEILVKITVNENRIIELLAYDPKHPEDRTLIQHDAKPMSQEDAVRERQRLGITVSSNSAATAQQPCIGIDLGTTTSELTYATRSENTELSYLSNPDVPYEYAEYCFPSVVYFEEDDGVPEVATKRACDALSDAGKSDRACGQFKIADRNKPVLYVGGKALSVQDLSMYLLNRIWNTAIEHFRNIQLKSAVVTVPAAFNSDACQDTYNAAIGAGIEKVTLIDEPTAAFLYYEHIQNLDTSNIENVLVFDFGGGTTDVAILDITRSGLTDHMSCKECLYTVLSFSGETSCGGKHVDEAILEEIKTRFETANGCKISAPSLQRLRKKVENAKIALSQEYSEVNGF